MFFYIKNDSVISVIPNGDSNIEHDFIIEKSFDPIIQYYKYDIELRDIIIYDIPISKQEEIKAEIGIPLGPPEIDPETGEEIKPITMPSKYDEEDKHTASDDRLDLIQGSVEEDGSMLNIAKHAYDNAITYLRAIIPFGTVPQLAPAVDNVMLVNCTFREYIADDLGIVQIKGLDGNSFNNINELDNYLIPSTRIENRKSLRTNWEKVRLYFPAFTQRVFTICGWFNKPKQWGALFGGRYWSLFNYVSNNSNYLGFYSKWDDLQYIDYSMYADKWTHIAVVFCDRDPESFKLYINGELQQLLKRYSWSTVDKNRYQLDDYKLGIGCESDGGNKTDLIVENFRVYAGELSNTEIIDDSKFEG